MTFNNICKTLFIKIYHNPNGEMLQNNIPWAKKSNISCMMCDCQWDSSERGGGFWLKGAPLQEARWLWKNASRLSLLEPSSPLRTAAAVVFKLMCMIGNNSASLPKHKILLVQWPSEAMCRADHKHTTLSTPQSSQKFKMEEGCFELI